MAQTLREAASGASWDEGERITCPTLVVPAGNGLMTLETAAEMTERLAGAWVVEIADAAHDVHLDRPDQWQETLTGLLESLVGQPA